jgi:hypothetical protein
VTGCDFNTARGLQINLIINGAENVGQVAFYRSVNAFTLHIPSLTGVGGFVSNQFPFVLSTGTQRAVTLTTSISDNCATTDHYTISAIRFDVLRFQ